VSSLAMNDKRRWLCKMFLQITKRKVAWTVTQSEGQAFPELSTNGGFTQKRVIAELS
jgi:hypothetical protein